MGNIHADVKPSRDFSGQGDTAATEGNTYNWARSYMQFQKPALANLGLLASSAANYTKTLVVVNACRPIAYFTPSSSFLRTDVSATDSLTRVFFRNYPSESVSATDFYFDYVPSNAVIAHEMNHFVTSEYLGVSTGKNCSTGNHNSLVHEGALGTLLPHLYANDRYSVGYAPSNTDRLWFSSSDVGRVHKGTSGLLTVSSEPCSGDVYHAGRVLGQALWKIAFSRDYDASGTMLNIQGITDVDEMVETAYEAARQAAGGSLSEFAWEFTWYAKNVLGILTNGEVEEWCELFERHELDGEFTSSCQL